MATSTNIPGIKCAVETKDLVSVKIGNINQAPPISNTLSFSCSFSKPLNPKTPLVYYCWHIHDKPSGTVNFTYRYATYQKNSSIGIGFNIYSHGLKVGDRRTRNNIIGIVSEWTSDTSFRVDDPIIVQWEDNAGKTLPAGKYVYDNPNTHFTAWNAAPGDDLNYANACGATNGDVVGAAAVFGNTTINVNVQTYCQLTADNMNFGKQPGLNKQLQQTADVHVDCSAGTDFDASIDLGQHPSGGVRQMQRQKESDNDPVTYVQYSVSPEKWHGVGMGWDLNHAVVQTITGTVPPQPAPLAGTYKDSPTITVTYYNKQ